MKLNKLLVAMLLPLNALAVTQDILPQTTYRTSVDGQTVTTNIKGELNYLYGVNDAKSHWYNSWFDVTAATSLYNGVDAVALIGVESEYDSEKDKYDEKLKGEVSISHNAHTLNVGYGNSLIGNMFTSDLKSSLDVGFTENAIGINMTERDGYAEYDFAYKDMTMGAGVTFGGEVYLSASKYLVNTAEGSSIDDLAISMIAFEEANGGWGVFASAATTVMKNVELSVGLGDVNDRFSYTLGGTYVFNDHLGFHTSVIGNDDYSTWTTGVEGVYENIAAYLDYAIDLNENYHGRKDSRVGAGIKVMF